MSPGRKPTVSDEEILAVFRDSEDPVLVTSEVAEEVDMTPRGTIKRLDDLASDGPLERKDAGRVSIWWLSED